MPNMVNEITKSAREPVIARLLQARRAVSYLASCSMSEVDGVIEESLKMLDLIDKQDAETGHRRGGA